MRGRIPAWSFSMHARTQQGGAAVARWAHAPKVAGSNPAPASMAEDVDMDDVLSEAAQGPKRAGSDGVSAEGHSLKDLIALDKHRTAKSVRANPAVAVTHTKLIPPGTT